MRLGAVQRPVSRKSRNFTGHFRVSQFPLYLKNRENFTVSLLLATLKTCSEIGIPKQAVDRFTNGYRDFRETGPRCEEREYKKTKWKEMTVRQDITRFCYIPQSYGSTLIRRIPELINQKGIVVNFTFKSIYVRAPSEPLPPSMH